MPSALTEALTLPRYSARLSEDWIDEAVLAVAEFGCCVVEDVLSEGFVSEVSQSMYAVRERIAADIGVERLEQAGELGVVRLMQRYHPDFFRFLEIPLALALIDRILSPTAIQHTQNGFILPSQPSGTKAPDIFQTSFHQDFPRILNGYLMSLNLYFVLSDFTDISGATQLVIGSHQTEERPSAEQIAERAVGALCPAGSMLVFDSTLWHASGVNRSGHDRLSINHQFTRSYIKQQIDYPRAIGADAAANLALRTQQLLGFYTRVPSTLDEYYQPHDRRLYRANQG